MKAITALLVTGSLVILLSGCTAYKHNKAGDAAAQTGDMRSAVYHYEQALAHRERYERDSDFLTKLAAARSQVAYDDATMLRSEGRFEQAIEQLRESMQQDPSYAEPTTLLPIVLKEAARWRYTQAVAAADAGDLEAAREHLTRAMQHDLTDESVAYAMASLTPESLSPDTPGLEVYRQGLSQAAERRWAEAEQTQLKSVAANGGLLPARAAMHDAKAQLTQARHLQRDGQALIDQLTMGPAIKSLKQSLAIWPTNDVAAELLTKAKAQQALADEQFAKATQAAGNTQWDDAIALADSGLAIDRSHPALGELRSALPRRAAADHTHRGDGHLEQGDLDKAHQAYARALAYRDTYRQARVGMATVYAAWAKQFEQAGQPGAALLNDIKGQSYTNSKTLDDRAVRLRSAIRDQLNVGFSVSTNERQRGAIDPRQLSRALLGTLESKQSHGLAIQDQGMPYELRLSINNASIDERLTNTARRTHHYVTKALEHNPEYDRIAARLRSAERDYDRACRAYNNAAGHNHHDSSIYSAKSRVDRLRHQLACTPHQISVTLHHDWHYTVETYTKTGELNVATQLIDHATGKPVKTFTHRARFAQSDNRTLNANPAVGVRHDELSLRRDDAVAATLTDELASAAGSWAVNTLVDHRLAQLNASIDALEQQGKSADALEARVQAAILLGIVDPDACQQTLDKLTQSHTR